MRKASESARRRDPVPVHAGGFSTSSYQLTGFACISTGKIEGRTVGEGTAGVFEGGMVGSRPVIALRLCEMHCYADRHVQ